MTRYLLDRTLWLLLGALILAAIDDGRAFRWVCGLYLTVRLIESGLGLRDKRRGK